MRKSINKKFKDSSKKWLSRHLSDQYVQRKKNYGFRSRSSFKLLEIIKKYKILKETSYVLDLGASPGGWSQVISRKVKNGKVMAVDILPMEKVKNVSFILGDFLDLKIQEKIKKSFNCRIDIITSDMASNTTGNKNLDSYRTSELSINSLDFSKKILKKDGVFLSKLFMGKEFEEIRKKARMCFKKVSFYKPNSSRKESRELYMICQNLLREDKY